MARLTQEELARFHDGELSAVQAARVEAALDVVEVLTAPPGEVRVIENAFQLPDDYSY